MLSRVGFTEEVNLIEDPRAVTSLSVSSYLYNTDKVNLVEALECFTL